MMNVPLVLEEPEQPEAAAAMLLPLTLIWSGYSLPAAVESTSVPLVKLVTVRLLPVTFVVGAEAPGFGASPAVLTV